MALSSQIESAARAGTGSIASGSADLSSDHALAMPVGDPVKDAAERRATSVTVAGRMLTHPCQLSKQAGIRVCLRKGHAADRADVREFLQMLGIVDTPAARRRKSARVGIDYRPTGRCPVCRTRQHIRMDMTIGVHGRDGRCDGEGQRPLPEEEP